MAASGLRTDPPPSLCCCTRLCAHVCAQTRAQPLPQSQQMCMATGTLTRLYGQDVGLHTQHTIPRVPVQSQTLYKGPPGQGKQLRDKHSGGNGGSCQALVLLLAAAAAGILQPLQKYYSR